MLEINEISDLYDLYISEHSTMAGDEYVNGGMKKPKTHDLLLNENLIWFLKKGQNVSNCRNTVSKTGWYLTDKGTKVIKGIIEKYYTPYVSDCFYKNKFIKENYTSISSRGNSVFIYSSNTKNISISFELPSLNIKYIHCGVFYGRDLEEIDWSINKLNEHKNYLATVQTELNTIEPVTPFIQFIKENSVSVDLWEIEDEKQ